MDARIDTVFWDNHSQAINMNHHVSFQQYAATLGRVFYLGVLFILPAFLGVEAIADPGGESMSAGGDNMDRFLSIDLRQVHVGGLIGQRLDRTVKNNLLVLDVEKDFLEPFRQRNQHGGFVGTGKLVDALVHFAAGTQDDQVLARKQLVVRELLKTQEADGYLGLMVPEARMWELWDVHEMVYLILGLTADHEYFEEKPSLEGARKLADYIIRRWTAEPEMQPGRGAISDHMAMTGIGSAMLALAQQTGDRRYLDFCTGLLHIPEWDYPIVIGRHGRIGGHAYAYLSRSLAQLKIYRLAADKKLLTQSRKALDFLLHDDGLVITGTCGDHECWHNTQAGTQNLGETCTAAYLIRWLDNLLRYEGEPRYGDIMERAIYNALFAAQSPDGRRIRYYTPFDGPRAYFDKDTYCCPNNYRRIVAELPGMVFYRAQGGVVVNLYTPATTTLELADGNQIEVRQDTDYPNSGKVVLHVTPVGAATFPLQLRIPAWCGEATVSVNRREAVSVRPGFHTVKREWQAGDTVELNMPMPWRLVQGRKAQSGRVAVLRGPMLYCLNRARHPELAEVDLRLLTLDPSSLTGPFPDDSVRPDGLACKVRAWWPGQWYPMAEPGLSLTLSEYADPAGEAVYFHVPDPNDPRFMQDELAFSTTEKILRREFGANKRQNRHDP